MEEKKSSVFFQLFFKSLTISQLSVHICDPQERQMTATTLFNYQQDTVSFVANHSHYYCLLNEPNNNTHIVDLSLPDKYKRSLSSEAQFSNFKFSAKVFFKYEEEYVDVSIDQDQFKELAKINLAKVKGKVFKNLQNQMFFRKQMPCRMTKTFIRKPKNKKNLTDLFFRNKNGEIKRAANNSSNNFSKFRCVQSPKLQQKDEDFLPEIPKLAKMNTSIEDISNCLSFLQSGNPSIHDRKSLNKKEAFEEKPPQKLQRVSFNNKERVKKIPKRQQFFKALYQQTRSQLDQQKQTLQLLRSFNQSQLKPIEENYKAKQRIKKKHYDITVIYNSKSIRH